MIVAENLRDWRGQVAIDPDGARIGELAPFERRRGAPTQPRRLRISSLTAGTISCMSPITA